MGEPSMNTQRLIQTFLTIVSIDSPSGSEDEMTQFLLRYCKEKNLTVSVDGFGNVIAKTKGKGEPLLLSAHIDTVEPGRGIKPKISNGKIHTNGKTILGADNKAAVAALMEVIARVTSESISSRPLEIVFTRSEEVANLGAVNLSYAKLSSKEGFLFDYAAPIGTIVLASPAYYRFDLRFIGKAAHASRPNEGKNIIPSVGAFLHNVDVGQVSKKTLVNIGVIKSGHVRNTIPGDALLQGEIRSFQEKEIAAYQKRMTTLACAVAADYGISSAYDFVRENGGYEYSQRDKKIQYVMSLLSEFGIIPTCVKAGGCSDANIFKDHGIIAVNLGNGGRNAHTVQEEIAVKDLELLTRFILSLIRSRR